MESWTETLNAVTGSSFKIELSIGGETYANNFIKALTRGPSNKAGPNSAMLTMHVYLGKSKAVNCVHRYVCSKLIGPYSSLESSYTEQHLRRDAVLQWKRVRSEPSQRKCGKVIFSSIGSFWFNVVSTTRWSTISTVMYCFN